jgi:hypothetical protein
MVRVFNVVWTTEKIPRNLLSLALVVEHHTFNIEDRIRELCHEAITAPDSDLEPIFKELNLLVQLHANNLRSFTVAMLRRTDRIAS